MHLFVTVVIVIRVLRCGLVLTKETGEEACPVRMWYASYVHLRVPKLVKIFRNEGFFDGGRSWLTLA